MDIARKCVCVVGGVGVDPISKAIVSEHTSKRHESSKALSQ